MTRREGHARGSSCESVSSSTAQSQTRSLNGPRDAAVLCEGCGHPDEALPAAGDEVPGTR